MLSDIRYNPDQAQLEIDQLRTERKVRRRLSKDPYKDLIPFEAEILQLAQASMSSKRLVAAAVNKNFGVKVSADRIYRMVISRLGFWPNRRVERDEVQHG